MIHLLLDLRKNLKSRKLILLLILNQLLLKRKTIFLLELPNVPETTFKRRISRVKTPRANPPPPSTPPQPSEEETGRREANGCTLHTYYRRRQFNRVDLGIWQGPASTLLHMNAKLQPLRGWSREAEGKPADMSKGLNSRTYYKNVKSLRKPIHQKIYVRVFFDFQDKLINFSLRY